MKKIITGLSLVLIVTCAYVLFTRNQASTKAPEKIPGALEALKFNGERQVYPFESLPSEAYSKAWETFQKENQNTQKNVNDPLPYESLGPLNRGGRTLALVFNPENPNTMYAGSASGGLWKTHSGGQGINAWEQVNIGIPVLGVSSITFAPDDTLTMYVGTGEVYNVSAAGTGAAYRNTRGSWGMGILKTTDGGVTWSKSLDWTYNQEHGIWAIKIDPNNSNLIYAATTDGVYKSTNAGSTWAKKLNVVMVTDLVIKPSNPNEIVVTCGNFGSPGYGIYKSTDGGANWTKKINGVPTSYQGKGQLAIAPSDENIIYASIGNGFSFADGASWLCRSTDFGETWEIRNQTDYSKWQGWFAHDVAVSPTDPTKLVIIGIEVWVSENAGLTMNQETQGGIGYTNPPIEGPDGDENFVHSDAHDVVFHPTNSNIVYVASDGGIHRSDDGGFTWKSASGSYQTAQFYNGTSSSLVDESIYTGGLQDNGTIIWNGDQTWRRTFGGDGSWTATHPTNSDILFNSYQNLSIVKSSNAGQDFQFLDIESVKVSPTSFIAPYVISPSNSSVMYAGSSVIAKSTTNGINWSVINAGNQLDGNPILSMEVSATNENVLYAATAPYQGKESHVFVTTDGNIFNNITQGLPNRYPMDMTVDPTDESTAYITYSGFGTGHVFKTTNYGDTWEDISEGLPDIPTNAVIVDPLYPDHVYIGNDFGVFLSVDGGKTWESFQEGMPNVTMVFDLKIAAESRKLRVATHGNGAYQRDLVEGDVSSIQEAELGMTLRVYPNPSKGTFQLEFDNTEKQHLHIEIINSQGQTLQNVKSEVFDKGNQKIDVSIENVTQGIYFIKVSNGKDHILKPISLLN